MTPAERAALDADPAYAAWLEARFEEWLAELDESPAYRVVTKQAEVRRRFDAARQRPPTPRKQAG